MSAFGDAYLARPDAGEGPGVLVLHSWWGLTRFFRNVCDRLAVAGYVALAPDLLAGHTPDTPDEAQRILAEADMNDALHLVRKAGAAVHGLGGNLANPIGVVGFSMGASWALWLSARAPDLVGATVAYYGIQNVDFADARSAYQGHFAEFDALVSDDDVVELEAHLRLAGHDTEFWRYPGTSHWFVEDDRDLAFRPDAAALAWDRTLAFLRRHLAPPRT
jgi:carboxymethylenebutenolidase